MATSFPYIPVDAITQPTGRIELSETLPAMPAHGNRWRMRMTQLAVAGISAAVVAAVAVHSTTSTAAQSDSSAAASTINAELARARTAVVVLAAAPVKSIALELALGQQRAALGATLARQGDLEAAVVALTAALLVIDRIALDASVERDASLARARVDGSLGDISALRGQRDRAYLYTRAGITLTEQLLAADAGDTEARALDGELRAALAKL